LPEQPIFYPVCNLEYAVQLSLWNKGGTIVKFEVDDKFISKHLTHCVGSYIHTEYWIRAEELEEFNDNIIGLIEEI
jgi:hypothetical protein